MKDFYKHLKSDKIEINWNKNPIKMSDFLSFLTVKTEISNDHIGFNNGWTFRFNNDESLYVKGGVISGVEYLNDIQYGENQQNQYNNYVNPFYILHLMNETGKKFFVEYYKADINELLESAKERVCYASNHLKKENKTLQMFSKTVKILRTESKTSTNKK